MFEVKRGFSGKLVALSRVSMSMITSDTSYSAYRFLLAIKSFGNLVEMAGILAIIVFGVKFLNLLSVLGMTLSKPILLAPCSLSLYIERTSRLDVE